MFPKMSLVIINLVLMKLFLVVQSEALIESAQPNGIDLPPEKQVVPDLKLNNLENDRTGRAINKECSSGKFSAKCLKIRAISFIDDLNNKEELPLFSGLSIVKENSTSPLSPEEMAAELTKKFPGKPDEKLNRFLLYRLQDYLDGHSLKYKLLDPETSKEAMDMAKGETKEVGRKTSGLGGGKGGGMGSLLAAAVMMKGTLAAAALGALALLAGKALMTALLSLLLSALVGLKGGGGKSTTYEIITKPVVSHHHTQSHEEHHEHAHGHHDGYRRAYDTSYLPYNNYT